MRIAFALIVFIALQGCQKQVKDTSVSCPANTPATVSLVAATFQMGADGTYPEEGPARTINVSSFNIDATEVTNTQFAAFVNATGYVTDAEKPQPGFDKVGAAVFISPNLAQAYWWAFVEGADWRHPEGPDTSIKGHDHDPVVQISHSDAKAYAKWKGRRLPTEAEWEFAARAGSNTLYVWGENRVPDGKHQANTWQGAFPIRNSKMDGFELRAPVRCFPANGFGLYDMIGNVWEWTDTIYQNSAAEPIYTIKGGSFLCAPNYCRRNRASARQPQEAGFSTNHIGFRTVKSE